MFPERLVSQYVNITANKENGMGQQEQAQIIKMPQIAKKEVQAYQQSTFEKAGLMGPPTGVSIMCWSYDSRYLATKCDQLPQVTWIWDI